MEFSSMDFKEIPDEIENLLEFFSKNTYKATERHPQVQHVMQHCLNLFGLDYTYSVINNSNGELSTNYPSSLIILENDKNDLEDVEISTPANGSLHSSSSFIHPEDSGFNNVQQEIPKIKDLINFARYARCRARFPVPVILFNNKHICRSATLSGGPEIYGRSSLDYFFSGGADNSKLLEPNPNEDDVMATENQSDWQLFDRVRHQDIRLLKHFQVQTIVDLMVEKKKVKFGVNISSSEKVDRQNRYADFKLISLPYPGCEFFKQYRDNDYNAEALVFEWNQGHVDANIFVPPDLTSQELNLEWSQYRDWDLVRLTQNYLKLLLAYIKGDHSESEQNGMLIHCISGWDRTPLFISLLRLSLWADGAIHKSLSPEQILYLTLAYDWLLFGHNLEDRLSKGEEILFFCFSFLKHITDDEFSVSRLEPAQPVVLSSVRNDSDIHLDGVLLDGDTSHTSPGGSSWSLNSCGSSQSSNPPTYFQVSQESWEVCSNATQDSMAMCQQTKQVSCQTSVQGCQNNNQSQPSSISSYSQQPPSYPNGSISNGHSPSSKHLLPNSFSSNKKTSSSPQSSSSSSSSCCALSKGTVQIIGSERSRVHGPSSSPVAVPVPNRNFNHHHHQHRTESNSSASIGSWQLVTGMGSLRDGVSFLNSDAISSSDPGSTYSHASRSSGNDVLDCIEASESSCTLVEDFTPINSKPNSSSTLNGGSRRDSRNFIDDEFLRDDTVILSSTPSRQHVMTDPLSIPLPLPHHDILNQDEVPIAVSNTKTMMLMSTRHRRLEAVRTTFYNLYTKTIQTRGGLNDSNSSLSVLMNFANKVGIRTATIQRNTS